MPNLSFLEKNFSVSIVILTFVFFPLELFGQNKPPGYKEGTFKDLIEDNQLGNIKSGVNITGIRNDTIFVIFYLSLFNDLFLMPIGHLKEMDKKYYYENRSSPNIKYQLRPTNGILSTQILTSFVIQKDRLYIFKQQLGAHVILRNNDNISSFVKDRILFYSEKRGLHKIEYFKDESVIQDEYFNWPFVGGDFIFD